MGTVIIDTTEYNELIQFKQKYQEVLNTFIDNNKMTFPEHSIKSYSIGEFPRGRSLPEYFLREIQAGIVDHILTLPQTDLARFFQSERTFLSIVHRSLDTSEYGNIWGYIDLGQDPQIMLRKKYWESCERPPLDADELCDICNAIHKYREVCFDRGDSVETLVHLNNLENRYYLGEHTKDDYDTYLEIKKELLELRGEEDPILEDMEAEKEEENN